MQTHPLGALVRCVQKPDSYPFGHIILHAAAGLVPLALAFWHPIAAAVSVACWGIVILIIGGHGERALGGNLGALGVSLGLGAATAAVSGLGLPAIAAASCLASGALAWLAEYHQNGGDWCGEDVANFHSRVKGAGVNLAAATTLAVFIL